MKLGRSGIGTGDGGAPPLMPMRPQHCVTPPVVSPQTKLSDEPSIPTRAAKTSICENVRPPATGVGVGIENLMPSPSSPSVLPPQHHAADWVSSAQVADPPVEMTERWDVVLD